MFAWRIDTKIFNIIENRIGIDKVDAIKIPLVTLTAPQGLE